MLCFKVSVSEGDEPPNDGKRQPTQHEAQRENQHRPPPLDVHHRREDVGQVSTTSFGHVRLHHVAFAVLHDDPLAYPP